MIRRTRRRINEEIDEFEKILNELVDNKQEGDFEITLSGKFLAFSDCVDDISNDCKTAWRNLKSSLNKAYLKTKSDCKMFFKKHSLIVHTSWEVIQEVHRNLKYMFNFEVSKDNNLPILSEDDIYKVMRIKPLIKPNILIIGPTGAGKSTISSLVLNTESKIVSGADCGTTQLETFDVGRWQVIDTIGLNDRNPETAKNAVLNLVNFLLENRSINLVIVVVPDGRLDAPVLNTLELFKYLIPIDLPVLMILSHSKMRVNDLLLYREKLKEMKFPYTEILQTNLEPDVEEETVPNQNKQIRELREISVDMLKCKIMMIMGYNKQKMFSSYMQYLKMIQTTMTRIKRLFPTLDKATDWDKLANNYFTEEKDKQRFFKCLEMDEPFGIEMIESMVKTKEKAEQVFKLMKDRSESMSPIDYDSDM